jgi:hypothetical protein
VYLWGFNVFVMPKHGRRTVNQLTSRHLEVLQYIRREFNDRIGLYGEGLGGYMSSSTFTSGCRDFEKTHPGRRQRLLDAVPPAGSGPHS